MPESTFVDVRPVSAGPRPVLRRRIGIGVLLLIAVSGATGLLGVRTAEAQAEGGGHRVTVEYAAVARAGLDVPWSVTVHRPGGFTGPVTLAVTSEFLDLHEEQGLDPEPIESTADPESVYWTFAPPPGEVLVVSFDAYVQPAAQWGADGRVVLIEAGEPLLEVPFRTWLVP